MFWFKRCPRCTGDLYEEGDRYGNFVTCVQCGFSSDVYNKLGDPLDLRVEPVSPPTVPKYEGGKRRRLSHGGRHFAKTFDKKGNPTNHRIA